MTILENLLHTESPILEKLLRPILVYVFLLLALRATGKRQLAQLNAFDLIVLLMLSNTVQNAIIGIDDSLLGGILGASSLLGFNYMVVHLLCKHPKIAKFLQGEATPLIENGQIDEMALAREDILESELEEAAHRQGLDSLESVETACLEPSGIITFTEKTPSAEVQRHQAVLDQFKQLSDEVKQLRQQLDRKISLPPSSQNQATTGDTAQHDAPS